MNELQDLRRFLYITPYFPPQSRVGALRPLKFARHLPSHGWAPVVLCDLKPDDAMDPGLVSAIPKTTIVVRDYGILARYSEKRFFRGKLPSPRRDAAGKKIRSSPSGPVVDPWPRIRVPPFLIPSPELFPLCWDPVDMLHGLRAGRGILRRVRCEAIMVNANPYAAVLVGGRLSRKWALPLILDLRDPWSVCALKRPLRPAFHRRQVDRMERQAVTAASSVILNTEKALLDYRRHYDDLPPDRFVCIRNHVDPELIASGSFQRRAEFTLLYLGSFRRFVEGEPLLRMLEELKARGYGSSQLKLVVSGFIPGNTWDLSERLGVRHLLNAFPFVSYLQVGPFMESADLLITLSHRADQRIPAKFFDYLASSRPILVATDNPEMEALARSRDGVSVCPLADTSALADAVEREILLGRNRRVKGNRGVFDSATATARLARILDGVTGPKNSAKKTTFNG